MSTTSGIIAGSSSSSSTTVTTRTITNDSTIIAADERIEIDASSGDIIITLPTITSSFKSKVEILFKRIDTSLNTVTFVGTSSNFEDENFQLGNDPQQGTIRIYASNNNIWRTSGLE